MGAAEESRKEISLVIDGADMVIIVAGMGGGTGTGSTPVVAEIAKSKGILTIGVVTKPYLFEGKRKMKCALDGIEKLKNNVDTLIVISNQKLLENSDKPSSEIAVLFKESDNILRQVVQSITGLITKPSLICLDIFDIRAIMSGSCFACIGIGRASGKNRFEEAAMSAIKNSLIEPSVNGTANILLSIAHGKNDGDEVAHLIMDDIDKVMSIEATIIYGTYEDENLEEEVIVTAIRIGLEKISENFVYSEPSSDTEIQIPFTPHWAVGKRKKPKDL